AFKPPVPRQRLRKGRNVFLSFRTVLGESHQHRDMRDAVEVLSEARDRQEDHRTSDTSEKFAPLHPVSRIDDREHVRCGSLPGEYLIALCPLASKRRPRSSTVF